jgi:phospholipase/lecithinase/hemolysin
MTVAIACPETVARWANGPSLSGRWIRRFLAATICLLVASPDRADAYSALYAFGDSLSDAGNLFMDTGGLYYAPPYYNGHATNSLTWVEDLSLQLGLGPLLPSKAGGNDYAYGFAATGPAVPGAPASVPNINQQVARFTAATGGHAPSTGLYAVWIGANDIIQALDDVGGGIITPGQAVTDLGAAAQAASTAIHTLATEGAKTFVVPTIPDLAKAPDVIAIPGLGPLATSLTDAYDTALLADVGALVGSDGIDVRFIDMNTLIDGVISDPAMFGLTDTTDPCYVGTLQGGGTVCATPDQYLFWDGEHPTAVAHRLVAEAAATAVPAPSALPLFASGVLWLAATRIRRRRV